MLMLLDKMVGVAIGLRGRDLVICAHVVWYTVLETTR